MTPVEQIVLVHLSDLHFGLRPAENRLNLLQRGRAPHRRHIADKLPLALDEVLDDYGLADLNQLAVLVSGDLTAGGDQAEFGEAFRYLDKLGIPQEKLMVVAGNHDHWNNGHWPSVPAFSDGIYAKGFFPTTPSVKTFVSAPSAKIELDLHAVDSASGVRQILAIEGVGDFAVNSDAIGAVSIEELNLLEQRLSARPVTPGSTRVRAIVCHHSLAYGATGGIRAGRYDAIFGANRLHVNSRQRLLEIAYRNQVTAVLCGHIHRDPQPCSHRQPLVGGTGARLVWEVTATTTMQDPVDGVQGFWVHSIALAGGLPHWEVSRYQFDDDGQRFERTQGPVTL